MISSNADKVIKELSLLPYEEVDLNHPLLKKECCQTAFIRGNLLPRVQLTIPRKAIII